MSSQQDQPINEYDIGDRPTLKGTFRDPETDTLVSPDTVTCRVKKPDGTFVDPAPTATEASVGIWTAQYEIVDSGPHWYHFKGSGAVVAAGERMFKVKVSEFPVI